MKDLKVVELEFPYDNTAHALYLYGFVSYHPFNNDVELAMRLCVCVCVF